MCDVDWMLLAQILGNLVVLAAITAAAVVTLRSVGKTAEEQRKTVRSQKLVELALTRIGEGISTMEEILKMLSDFRDPAAIARRRQEDSSKKTYRFRELMRNLALFHYLWVASASEPVPGVSSAPIS